MGPVALRYPRGSGVGVPLDDEFHALPIGKAELLTPRDGDRQRRVRDPGLSATWSTRGGAGGARAGDEEGIRAVAVNARWAKPLDEELILRLARATRALVTIEDGVVRWAASAAPWRSCCTRTTCTTCKPQDHRPARPLRRARRASDPARDLRPLRQPHQRRRTRRASPRHAQPGQPDQPRLRARQLTADENRASLHAPTTRAARTDRGARVHGICVSSLRNGCVVSVVNV